MHDRFRDALLGAWGHRVASRPMLTLGICLVVAAAAVLLTVLRLEFRPDRDDLIDEDLSWNRRYAQYKDSFQRWGDLIVCVEGDADDERIDTLTRDIAATLLRDDRVVAADAGFSIAQTGARLFAAAPEEIFDRTLGELAEARSIAAAANANAALAVALGQLGASEADPDDAARIAGPSPADDAAERLSDLLAPYLAALDGGVPDFSFLRPDQPRWRSFVSGGGSGRLRFVQVQLAPSGRGIDQITRNLVWLRGAIGRVVDDHPGVSIEWGVTGIPAIEADETAQSIHDSTLASIVAFLLITVLMLVVFRGVVVPLLAAGALLVGMAWSFGWLVLSVGHLQLLSVVFSVILLGLGIDFALHLIARLELVQDEHDDLPSAIARVYRGIGPGMLTGAVTTAAAFGATALTEFTGMKEMGIIAGGGILLCLIAVLTSFPAALALTGRWKRIIRHRHGGEGAHFARGALDAIDFHPRPTLVMTILVVAAMAVPALRVQYDPNVLNLHPPHIESVRWERRIAEADAATLWSAIVATDAADAAALVDRLRALPEVSDVGGMGLLLPSNRATRATRIAEVRSAPVTTAPTPAGLEPLRRQLAAVRLGLTRRADTTPAPVATRLRAIADRVAAALAASATLDAADAAQRSAALEAAFREARGVLAAWLDEALAPVPPAPADLPPVLRELWVDGDTWLLLVLPHRDDRSILHPERLAAFVAAVEAVAPQVTGPAVQIQKSSELIRREYVKAAIYAIAAILIVLLLDFRSLPDALCAMLPVSIGFVGAFGLMGLFGVPLNFANIIVLPLIFGIGVDAGVHVVHRWRAEPYGRPAGLSGGTGRGITLTMLTTSIGFGCMLLAEHRGIRSLGFVMVAGLLVTLLACYTMLPAVLRLRTGGRRQT